MKTEIAISYDACLAAIVTLEDTIAESPHEMTLLEEALAALREADRIVIMPRET